MKSKKKNLIIISGATGSIGSTFFERFILDDNFHVVGLSRSGFKTSEIPTYNSIVHFDFENNQSFIMLGKLIKANSYKKILYVHGVGKFTTEINYNKESGLFSEPEKGNYIEEVVKLTFDYTSKMINFLGKNVSKETKVTVVNIASLSDEFEIPIFQSWKHAQDKLIAFFNIITKKYKNFSTLTVRVSTILGAKELIDRPHLFSTNTDPNFWLPKSELVDHIARKTKYFSNSSKIDNLFRQYPKFEKKHWNNEETLKRRVKELFNIN